GFIGHNLALKLNSLGAIVHVTDSLLRSHFPGIGVKYTPRDKFVPSRGTLSMEKARRLLGFEPQYPVEKGFPKYIEWYKSLFARRGNVIGPHDGAGARTGMLRGVGEKGDSN